MMSNSTEQVKPASGAAALPQVKNDERMKRLLSMKYNQR